MVTSYLKIKDNTYELLALMATCIIISSCFMILFNNGYKKGSFFSRWFAKVGFRAVVYDTILVSTIFVIMKIIPKTVRTIPEQIVIKRFFLAFAEKSYFSPPLVIDFRVYCCKTLTYIAIFQRSSGLI